MDQEVGLMSLNLKNIYDALHSHAQSSGLFQSVQRHDPKSGLGAGQIACGIALREVTTARSGLNATSARVNFDLIMYGDADGEPADSIDPTLAEACDTMISRLVGDLTLGGAVANIDVQGSDGSALGVQAGYFEGDDNTYRVFTVSIGVIVNDAWTHGV